MSTLLEIEAATEALPHEQKEELFRFLAVRLHPANSAASRKPGARLVQGPNGTLLLEAPPSALEAGRSRPGSVCSGR
jgi:hypothetical protein